MKKRRILGMKVETWEEARQRYTTISPDKNVMGFIDYMDLSIGIGSENPAIYNDDYNNIDTIAEIINHEVCHWTIYYREDVYIPERRVNDYEIAACRKFDNIARWIGL